MNYPEDEVDRAVERRVGAGEEGTLCIRPISNIICRFRYTDYLYGSYTTNIRLPRHRRATYSNPNMFYRMIAFLKACARLMNGL